MKNRALNSEQGTESFQKSKCTLHKLCAHEASPQLG